MTPKKATSSINPDAAAAAATKKVAPKPKPEPNVQDAYTQLALEWALRRAFDGPMWRVARRRVEKEPMLDPNVRQVLLDRIDLMG